MKQQTFATPSTAFLRAAACVLIGIAPVVLGGCKGNASSTGADADEDAPHSTAAIPEKASTVKPGSNWMPPVSNVRQDERDAMCRTIRDKWGVTDQAVLEAMDEAPRHEFVPEKISANAYDDDAEPIAYGQLISQPQIVARMTHELHLTANSKVLEIGTGSGYQSAILSYFTQHVFSIEIIKPMADEAAARLTRLGYDPIQTRCADGFNGWPEEAPFDAIIVTCAAGRIPPPLIKQLAPGGRMMIPVGQPFADQSLMLVEKSADGRAVQTRSLDYGVRFVPMLQKDITSQGK